MSSYLFVIDYFCITPIFKYRPLISNNFMSEQIHIHTIIKIRLYFYHKHSLSPQLATILSIVLSNFFLDYTVLCNSSRISIYSKLYLFLYLLIQNIILCFYQMQYHKWAVCFELFSAWDLDEKIDEILLNNNNVSLDRSPKRFWRWPKL